MSDLSQRLVLSFFSASKEALGQAIEDKSGNPSLCAVTLDELLIPRPASTVIFPVRDGAMHYGLMRGDLLIVDRAAKPENKQLVIISTIDGLIFHRFNPSSFTTLSNLSDETENGSHGLPIWGTVTYIIRKQ